MTPPPRQQNAGFIVKFQSINLNQARLQPTNCWDQGLKGIGLETCQDLPVNVIGEGSEDEEKRKEIE
ncbi:hypothetical protein CFIMG_008068RA00001 [Ceratocystis fimbriata CBS 114723]|uniref:Uncharacterized protein n=1 Tax=Ceratocystis fimbriata CBS 114723 TaxID=1035309 RepID=A0A2C5X9I0_9PEZI|nr:hypothetical protein CFIMG_008068RA00001 [Ceratocystis fimbriata CBS 114723]